MVVDKWHTDNPVAKANTTRLCRNKTKEHLWRTHVRIPTQRMVLDRPNSVKTNAFSLNRLVDTILQSLPFVFS
jgi:hypothetical protein